MDFPIGAELTLETLTHDPYEQLAELRRHEPVSWVPAIDGWLITDRDLGLVAMRDADTFTVDDPRFSTAAVLGQSMLSLDGEEHQRHRKPFAPSFRPGIVRERFGDFLDAQCKELLAALPNTAELRGGLAGPLAVNTITRFLDLRDVTADEVLSWYHHISDAIEDVTLNRPVSDAGTDAVRQINRRVAETLAAEADAGSGPSLLQEIEQTGALGPEEMGSAAVVLMFGAIETAEGMTANAFWHLLSHPDAWAELRQNRALIPDAIEESLRLEPAAAFIDRYATRDVTLGTASIAAGDLVSISLLAANRDPNLFADPDRFDIHRSNARQHLTFVQGPHSCLGLHLTRMETAAAINAMLDTYPDVSLVETETTAPSGFIFRKPDRVTVALHP